MAMDRFNSDMDEFLFGRRHIGKFVTGCKASRYKARFHEEPGMAVQRTLSIIKPDATRRNLSGEIIARFEKSGLRVIAQKRLLLSRSQAEAFYAVHRQRPFFGGLVSF